MADGTTTPVDFGEVVIGSSVSKTFTINNTGGDDLTLTEPLSITGTDISGTATFADTVIAPGASTTVDVTLTGNGVGTLTGEIALTNDDSDENPFNFPIQLTASSVEIGSVMVPPPLTFKAGDNLDFIVNFTQPVTVTGDVTLPITLDTGTVDAALVGTGSSSNFHIFRYTIAPGDIDNNNGLEVNNELVLASGAAIRDASGNEVTGTLNNVGDTTGINIDAIAPTITGITRQNPTDANINSADSVTYAVTFSEAVKNLDTGDFNLSTTGTAGGAIASLSATTGTTVNVTINNISGEGELRLDTATDPTITDNAGNSLTEAFNTGETYTLDSTPPDTPIITNDGTTADTTPDITGTAEAGSTVTIYQDGTELGTTIADADGNWTFTPTTALTEGTFSLTAQATDAAGNISATSTATSLIIDSTPPVVPIITSDGTTADTTPDITGTAEAG
ncbi:MAG: Ig-like domain-containing protein, partial [Limnospira sp.]